MADINYRDESFTHLEPLASFFSAVASIPETAKRVCKRLLGQPVTMDDYSQVWAEIHEDGSPVHGSKSDTPSLILCATRLAEKDEWVVEKHRLLLPPMIQDFSTSSEFSSSPMPMYECVESLGTLSTSEVVLLMSIADPEERSAPSHYTRAFN